MSQDRPLDFTGQTIYVGIDVHRKDWKVSIVLDKLVYKTFSQPPCAEVLSSYLKRHFPGADYQSVYEAGFCGFWIHEALVSLGIENIVVNPADVPTTDKERRQKTDKRDCLKLGLSLRGGILEKLHVPSRLLLEQRGLVRLRDRRVSDLVRTKNRIKAHLHFFGIGLPEVFSKCNWSNNFLSWLSGLEMESIAGKAVLESLLKQLQLQRQLLKESTDQVSVLSKTPFFEKKVRLLKSIPGIGLIGAMKILTELGDMTRFIDFKHLVAYAGLIPNTNSSGEHQRVGDMTHRGNKQIKKMLIEASWVAIRNDPAMALKYQALCTRMKGQKAIIRIARKLLSRIRFVLVNEEKYKTGVVG